MADDKTIGSASIEVRADQSKLQSDLQGAQRTVAQGVAQAEKSAVITVRGDATVPLAFSWQALDTLGTAGMAQMLGRARSPEAGAVGVLADLVTLAADGAVSKEEVLAASPPVAEALSAVLTAYLYAMHGRPEPEVQPATPAPERAPWWRRL